MPSRVALVAEAIERLNTAGLRSQLLKIDTKALADLGLRLTDRELSIRDAFRWLNGSLGGTDEEPAIDDNAVYRFAANFRKLYEQVRAENARRIARLSVEHATAGNVEQMNRVAQARLSALVAEKLIETDNLEQLSATELAGSLAAIDAWSKGQLKREELALKIADGERKAAKLEADLAKAKLEIEERSRKLQAAIEAAKKNVVAIEKKEGAPGGGLSRAAVYELLDQVMKGEAA